MFYSDVCVKKCCLNPNEIQQRFFLQGKESCLVGTCPRSRPVDVSRWSVVRTKGDESKA